MELNENSIAAFKTILTNPLKYGFSFKSIIDCFDKTEEATPKHILYNQYVEYIQKPLPKIFFYIIMDEMYEQKKAANNDMGYMVKLNTAS